MDSGITKTFSPHACIQVAAAGGQEEQGMASPLLPFPPDLPECSLLQQWQLVKELLGRVPISHTWDVNEPQVLAVEWTQGGQGSQGDMWPHKLRAGNSMENYGVPGSQSTRFRKVSDCGQHDICHVYYGCRLRKWLVPSLSLKKDAF